MRSSVPSSHHSSYDQSYGSLQHSQPHEITSDLTSGAVSHQQSQAEASLQSIQAARPPSVGHISIKASPGGPPSLTHSIDSDFQARQRQQQQQQQSQQSQYTPSAYLSTPQLAPIAPSGTSSTLDYSIWSQAPTIEQPPPPEQHQQQHQQHQQADMTSTLPSRSAFSGGLGVHGGDSSTFGHMSRPSLSQLGWGGNSVQGGLSGMGPSSTQGLGLQTVSAYAYTPTSDVPPTPQTPGLIPSPIGGYGAVGPVGSGLVGAASGGQLGGSGAGATGGYYGGGLGSPSYPNYTTGAGVPLSSTASDPRYAIGQTGMSGAFQNLQSHVGLSGGPVSGSNSSNSFQTAAPYQSNQHQQYLHGSGHHTHSHPHPHPHPHPMPHAHSYAYGHNAHSQGYHFDSGPRSAPPHYSGLGPSGSGGLLGKGMSDIKHRRRTTKSQYRVLEDAFQSNPKPLAEQRKAISEAIGMPGRAVQIWFQNRRAKEKSARKRAELGAAAAMRAAAAGAGAQRIGVPAVMRPGEASGSSIRLEAQQHHQHHQQQQQHHHHQQHQHHPSNHHHHPSLKAESEDELMGSQNASVDLLRPVSASDSSARGSGSTASSNPGALGLALRNSGHGNVAGQMGMVAPWSSQYDTQQQQQQQQQGGSASGASWRGPPQLPLLHQSRPGSSQQSTRPHSQGGH